MFEAVDNYRGSDDFNMDRTQCLVLKKDKLSLKHQLSLTGFRKGERNDEEN